MKNTGKKQAYLSHVGFILIGIVEDFKDISERKEAEQALMQSHERLRDLTSHLQVVLEQVRKEDWDLILLDISMPGRGGIDTLFHALNYRPAHH